MTIAGGGAQRDDGDGQRQREPEPRANLILNARIKSWIGLRYTLDINCTIIDGSPSVIAKGPPHPHTRAQQCNCQRLCALAATARHRHHAAHPLRHAARRAQQRRRSRTILSCFLNAMLGREAPFLGAHIQMIGPAVEPHNNTPPQQSIERAGGLLCGTNWAAYTLPG
jgi:hypothetical protein